MSVRQNVTIQLILDSRRASRRMLKMAVQQGRSERGRLRSRFRLSEHRFFFSQP
jgi:hypothetical protein